MNLESFPYMRAASSRTWVPYVLFMVKAREFPKELSTCVCRQDHIKKMLDRRLRRLEDSEKEGCME